MTTVKEINNAIKQLEPVLRNGISDDYHTFRELYDHRCILWIHVCKTQALYLKSLNTEDSEINPVTPVWRSKAHSDGTSYDGWFILGIGEQSGTQMTYHLPMHLWSKCGFANTLATAPGWDGHTPDEVLQRLTSSLSDED